MSVAEDVPVDVSPGLGGVRGGHEGRGRHSTQITAGPVLDVRPRPVLTQQLVVVGSSVPRPDGLVTTVSVITHGEMVHEGHITSHCKQERYDVEHIETL